MTTRQQNVLFILIDQFRADLLHGALADHVDLPNLRALKAEAVSFERHYSVVNPCGPSRVSILTGQYAMNHRAVRNGAPLRHDTPNLALEARKAGYQPLLFGYTDVTRDPRRHHRADPALRSYEQPMAGFDEVLEMRLEESYPWRAALADRGYDLPDYARFYVPQPAPGQPLRLNDPAFYRAEDSDTAFLTDGFLSHMRARQGAPWFAHLTYIRPHPPLVAPAPYNRMYDPNALPRPLEPAAGDTQHPYLDAAAQIYGAQSTVNGFDDWQAEAQDIQTLRAIYLGLASEVDHHIGRVIAFLKESGQYDDTLLIIGADHGEMLGDHRIWGKMAPFDAAFHVPLIIRDPRNNAPHGSSVSAITESVDLMPTLLDWIGLPVPASVDGLSLMPYLEGRPPDSWRDSSYSEIAFGNPIAATALQKRLGLSEPEASLAILRRDDLTLVHFGSDLPPLLFDHRKTGELTNMARDPACQADLLTMTQALLSRRMRHADSTLSNTMITPDGPVSAGDIERHG